jgi:hypothetical protein
MTGQDKSEISVNIDWLSLDQKATKTQVIPTKLTLLSQKSAHFPRANSYGRNYIDNPFSVQFDITDEYIRVPLALYNWLFKELN